MAYVPEAEQEGINGQKLRKSQADTGKRRTGDHGMGLPRNTRKNSEDKTEQAGQ